MAQLESMSRRGNNTLSRGKARELSISDSLVSMTQQHRTGKGSRVHKVYYWGIEGDCGCTLEPCRLVS